MPALAVENMLDLIGGTPIVRLRHLVDASMADVFCKCEQFNPGGSLKDRIALSMIEAAEREGRIRPGDSVIVEPTSGNTGVGLALVCGRQGLQADPHHARQHVAGAARAAARLRRRGAPDAGGAGHEGRGRTRARDLPRQPEGVHAAAVQQPGERRRARAHDRPRRSSPSSATASPTRSSHGVGTGGTITGVGARAARQAPRRAHRRRRAREERRAVGRSGRASTASTASAPASCPASSTARCSSEVRTISELDAQRMKLQLARARGPAGRHLGGRVGEDRARRRRASSDPARRVVTILCDTGERYFSSDAYFE